MILYKWIGRIGFLDFLINIIQWGGDKNKFYKVDSGKGDLYLVDTLFLDFQKLLIRFSVKDT